MLCFFFFFSPIIRDRFVVCTIFVCALCLIARCGRRCNSFAYYVVHKLRKNEQKKFSYCGADSKKEFEEKVECR